MLGKQQVRTVWYGKVWVLALTRVLEQGEPA